MEKLTLEQYNKKYKTMTENEYYEKFPGNMIYFDEEYYLDVNEIFEYMNNNDMLIDLNNLPEFYGTKEVIIALDDDWIISCLQEDENAYEDYEVTHGDKICEFVKEFNEKYADKSYVPNTNIIIRLNKNDIIKYAKENNVKIINKGECCN